MKKIIMFAIICVFAAHSYAADVLFIGDSHSVGPFGWKMDELIRNEPNIKLGTYASCGSVFNWWETGKPTPCGYFFRDVNGKTEKGAKGPTPIFDTLMEELKPQIVIVELGANYAGWASDNAAVEDMKKLVDKIADSGAKCFWISTPDARKGKENIPRVLRLTEEAVLPYCQFFDSTLVTTYPSEGGDGIHYWNEKGRPIAENWANEAFKKILPIIMELDNDNN
jgi:hypothetical protein